MKTQAIAVVKTFRCTGEVPVVSLQRICLGYLYTDWAMMATAGVRLVATLAVLAVLAAAPTHSNT